MLPTGRASLATKPASTESIKSTAPTIGTVLVAWWRARKHEHPKC
jgi:hypothetical protein